MFSQIIKFIRILSSETAPIQISAAFALAMVMGFTPLFSMHNLLVLFILLILRINLAAFLLAWAIFSGFAYLLDPLFHNIGLSLLNNTDLSTTWTDMYNSSFWRLTGFNNSIVMGSLAVSLAAFIPLLLIGNMLIRRYRSNVMEYIKNSAFFKFIQSSKWFSRFVAIAE